ncbi:MULTISPECIES: SDR family NAD(P)-dependent oxidoreductase [Escherichia]|uniref:SDR family oxidoreductase n=1 Tax=Escherichia whittamii TaxID=2762229 RepID=A0ABR8T9P4_9ESCH|nr:MULTISPECIES: SDR family oxidoreductase [Escherichia]QLX45102.1 SDR family oxidoreductase [Escherichia coli]MBD7972483.1 SDR family oxidoreductase [Escherichia whittamii]MCA4889679.1 SDR family oxidoreductase [Escherichia whittamii]MEC9496267.1 SDR family oxidoreductase [Escherichia whittamii]MEC9558221.1 SDR family oxidoreductase [Escherichia whittamii]
MNRTKTVIVTGASSGLGLAIAQAFLARNYNVVANARSLQRLQNMADGLGNPRNLLLVPGDISLPETAANLFTLSEKHFGQVDILVNNAGIFIAKPVTDYTPQDVVSMTDTNLKGFFYPAQAAARHMSQRGSGHIITITASIAMQPNRKIPALLPVLIKGGLNQAIRGLALELAPHNIMVNGVAPGVIATPMHESDEQSLEFLKGLAPTERIGHPQDIVDAVLYLADSTFVTGTVLTVDGGASAGVW